MDHPDADLSDLAMIHRSARSAGALGSRLVEARPRAIDKPLRIWLPAVRAGSGADVFTLRLAEALNRRGADARITWFPHWSEISPDLLRLKHRSNMVDVVHANSTYAFAFRNVGIPLVVTEHHYVLDPAYRPYKSTMQHWYHQTLMGPYMRRSYACADAVTTDSRFTAGVLASVAGIRGVQTIPLWADYDRYSPELESEPLDERAEAVFRLLFVGNASQRKGADVIPKLASRLGDAFEIRCTSGLRRSMKGSLSSNIRLLGRLSEEQLVREYRRCDAVLVPSRYEGFGYSALEAMACAKPVIGFSCGAIEEVVADGETGLLRPVDDICGLETDCRLLAADRSRARQMGRAGRERAIGVFSESKAVDAYMQLYASLIDGSQDGGGKHA